MFLDYPTRYAEGKIAQIPKTVGTTSREASALVPYPSTNETAGPSEELIKSRTLNTVCAAYNTSVYRDEADLVTYRYEWAGNFTNVSPVSWLGAYHYSDLYFFFGTYLIAPGVIPELEVQTSEVMQDRLFDFTADPHSLPAEGWPEYDTQSEGGGQLLRFGSGGQASQVVNGDQVDGACHIPGAVYDTTPDV